MRGVWACDTCTGVPDRVSARGLYLAGRPTFIHDLTEKAGLQPDKRNCEICSRYRPCRFWHYI